MSERTYSVGVPLAITVKDDGTVVLDIDIADADDDMEPVDDWNDLQVSTDALLVSEVAGRLGNCITMTIHPARNNA